MATGKELVRLTECGLWNRVILPDVDSHYFYNSCQRISTELCRSQTFCGIRIKLKNKRFSKKYVTLLSEFCQLIASTDSESMCVRVTKKKNYVIDIN